MFLIAAKTLGEETISLRENTSQLYPSFAELRDVSRKIAIKVGEYARAHHLAANSHEPVESLVDKVIWYPHYPTYLRADSK